MRQQARLADRGLRSFACAGLCRSTTDLPWLLRAQQCAGSLITLQPPPRVIFTRHLTARPPGYPGALPLSDPLAARAAPGSPGT